jgi:hypothetical protein
LAWDGILSWSCCRLGSCGRSVPRFVRLVDITTIVNILRDPQLNCWGKQMCVFLSKTYLTRNKKELDMVTAPLSSPHILFLKPYTSKRIEKQKAPSSFTKSLHSPFSSLSQISHTCILHPHVHVHMYHLPTLLHSRAACHALLLLSQLLGPKPIVQ